MRVFYIIRNVELVGRTLYVVAKDEVMLWFSEAIMEAKRFDTRMDASDFLEKWIKDKKTAFGLYEVVKIFDVQSLIPEAV